MLPAMPMSAENLVEARRWSHKDHVDDDRRRSPGPPTRRGERGLSADEARLALEQRFGPRFVSGGDGLVGTVSPETEAEVLQALAIARRYGALVVAQGSVTNPFGGATARRSLGLSFERLDRVLALDRVGRTVTVQPGIVWQDLIERLAQVDLMPCVYPSNWRSSTVGGFVAQGGVGMGSFQYGPIDRTVQRVCLATGDGSLLDLEDDDLELALGTAGRTGLPLRVALRLQARATLTALVAAFASVAELEACLEALAHRDFPIWSASFVDPAAAKLWAEAGLEERPALPVGRYALLLSVHTAELGALLPQLRGLVLASGGRLIPGRAPHNAWLECLMSLHALCHHSVPLRLRLPLGGLRGCLGALPPALRARLALEGVVADRGACLGLCFLPIQPFDSLAEGLDMAQALLRVTRPLGGRPEATGVLFPEEAATVYGEERLERLRQFCARTDPGHLFGGGKTSK